MPEAVVETRSVRSVHTYATLCIDTIFRGVCVPEAVVETRSVRSVHTYVHVSVLSVCMSIHMAAHMSVQTLYA